MRFPATPCLLATLLFCLPASAQTDDGPLQVVIDAESTAYDGNAGMLRFTGLKLTQGDISIESDDARSTGLDFESTTWHLVGNVVFDIDGSHIESGSADLTFEDFELQAATIAGSPATFEIRRAGADQPTFASARRLHYDVADGVIEFSGDASITEGGNRIAAETLAYNIRERRVNAVASGAPDDRVKVTFTPPASEAGTAGDKPAESETTNPDDEVEAERPDPDGGE
jgi:lipopolysaccharide transport protein LptA